MTRPPIKLATNWWNTTRPPRAPSFKTARVEGKYSGKHRLAETGPSFTKETNACHLSATTRCWFCGEIPSKFNTEIEAETFDSLWRVLLKLEGR